VNPKSPRTYSRPVPGFAQYDLDVRATAETGLVEFIDLSVDLTGFTAAELAATGMVKAHFEELQLTLGVSLLAAFLKSGLNAAALMESPVFGPLARNVIRMWYLGQWKRLPDEWLGKIAQTFSEEARKGFDEFGRNSDRVISSSAYRHGLAWAAIGAHAPATGSPGFASWARPPT